MTDSDPAGPFDLNTFLPYMLNQVAEAISKSFQLCYQKDFGLTRTQWRIMAHLYAADGLTAKQICALTHEDKVSISRGVAVLEAEGRLSRQAGRLDRRFDELHLTEAGRALFAQLAARARAFEQGLAQDLGAQTVRDLRLVLEALRGRLGDAKAGPDPIMPD